MSQFIDPSRSGLPLPRRGSTHERRRAALSVASLSASVAEAALILDMLDLDAAEGRTEAVSEVDE